jgi:hypothetical protein
MYKSFVFNGYCKSDLPKQVCGGVAFVGVWMGVCVQTKFWQVPIIENAKSVR